MICAVRIAAAAASFAVASSSFAADPDWSAVGRALGKEGSVQRGGIYRVGLPRTDLHVSLDGVALKAGFALGSWLAFEPVGAESMAQTMVMGDLVLTHDEVNPVMKKLEEGGINITALHNHLLRSSPATMYMHVLGHGDPLKLAQTLHEALALSKTPFAPAASSQAAPMEIEVAAIDRILGAKGTANGGVLQYGIPRAEKITDDGMPVPPAMGSAIAINFQPTGSGKAAITGDFVLLSDEVNPVLRALRENGIEVTAVHNHMLQDTPHLYFMHFWANDDAERLAKGLRAALDKTNVVRD